MTAARLVQRVVLLVLAAGLLAALLAVSFCAPRPQPPEPPTPPTATFPAPPTVSTVPATVAPPSPTPGPTAYPPGFTPKPTYRPPLLPTRTPRPTMTPTIEPTDTLEPPTATPIALRGRTRVQAGDTLWGIACRAYADIPLRPGANPLTPCTCWPGLWLANLHIEDARLILPGWRVDVPQVCIQAPHR